MLVLSCWQGRAALTSLGRAAPLPWGCCQLLAQEVLSSAHPWLVSAALGNSARPQNWPLLLLPITPRSSGPPWPGCVTCRGFCVLRTSPSKTRWLSPHHADAQGFSALATHPGIACLCAGALTGEWTHRPKRGHVCSLFFPACPELCRGHRNGVPQR